MIAIGNAAGDCKRLEQVIELTKTPANPIMLGSILHQERPGNEGNTFNHSPDYLTFLNSRGLPSVRSINFLRRHTMHWQRAAST